MRKKLILELLYIFFITLLFLRIFLILPFWSIDSADKFLDYFFSTNYNGMSLNEKYPIRFYKRLAFSVTVTFILTMIFFYWIKYLFRRKPYWLIIFFIFPLALILINLTPIGKTYIEEIDHILEATGFWSDF